MKEVVGHGANAITLRQIRYLAATAQYGNFAEAARRLHISQPAVFSQIKQLEDLLGASLLVRYPRGIELTKAGEVFLEHARVALGELDNAVRAVTEAIKPVLAGEIPLGMPPSVGRALFVDLLGDVKARAPDAKLLLREAFSDDLWNLVVRGELAAAFIYDPKPAASLKIMPLYEEDLYLVGTPEVVGHLPDEIGREALDELELVLDNRCHSSRFLIEQSCTEEGIDVSSALEVDSVAMKREMILHRGYCSIVPYGLFHEEIQSGALHARHITPCLRRTVGLAIHRDASTVIESLLLPIIQSHIERVIRHKTLGWRLPQALDLLHGAATPKLSVAASNAKREGIRSVA